MEQAWVWLRDALAALVMMFGGAAADPGLLTGYVEGEYARIAPRDGGRLVELKVARGDWVKQGDLLYALDADNELAARDDSRARLAQAEAQLDNLRKGRRTPEIDALIAQRGQAEAALKLSEVQLRRQERLMSSSAFSQENMDQARAAFDRDRARVAELTAQIAVGRLAARDDEIAAAEAVVSGGRAALRQAEWRLSQRVLNAQVEGRVTDTLFVAGEYVNAGAPVVVILPPANIKLRFFVPEPALGGVRVGQGIAFSCDGCPPDLRATVTYVSPQAEFTPPVIYSRETRAKLVYLVEARAAGGVALNPGQPVDVRLDADPPRIARRVP